jgi:hypothetical protein
MRTMRSLVLVLAAAAWMGVAAGSALASGPVWQGCVEVAKGGYEDSACTKEKAEGKFGWTEVTGTEKVTAELTLKLADTKVPLAGTVEVQCSGTGSGTVGPGSFARIEAITVSSCSAGEHCEKVEKNAAPLHLPWQTELFETEGTQRDTITNGKSSEAPGWAVTCKVLGVTKADECTVEGESTMVGDLSDGPVNAFFEEHSENAKCSVGGSGSGRARGTVQIKANQVGVGRIRFVGEHNFGKVNFGNHAFLRDRITVGGFEKTFGVPTVIPATVFEVLNVAIPCKNTTRAPGAICEVEVLYEPAKAGEKIENGLLVIPYEKTVAPKDDYQDLVRLRGES